MMPFVMRAFLYYQCERAAYQAIMVYLLTLLPSLLTMDELC